MPILFTPIQPILGILLLDPAFLSSFCSTNLSMHLTLWKFQCIALELKLLWKRWFTRAFHNLKHFGSFYTIFTWIWTYKNHDLTDHQLAIGSFLLAIASMGREQQILSLRWPRFCEQLLFPSVPSTGKDCFIHLILLQSLLLVCPSICAIWVPPLGPFVFGYLLCCRAACPVLHIALLCPPRPARPEFHSPNLNSFAKEPPHAMRRDLHSVQIRPSNRSGQFVFKFEYSLSQLRYVLFAQWFRVKLKNLNHSTKEEIK